METIPVSELTGIPPVLPLNHYLCLFCQGEALVQQVDNKYNKRSLHKLIEICGVYDEFNTN